jgi:hypothetical protein
MALDLVLKSAARLDWSGTFEAKQPSTQVPVGRAPVRCGEMQRAVCRPIGNHRKKALEFSNHKPKLEHGGSGTSLEEVWLKYSISIRTIWIVGTANLWNLLLIDSIPRFSIMPDLGF